MEQQVRLAIATKQNMLIKKDASQYREKRMDKALQYIQEHFAEDIKLEDVARRAGFNASYFATLFHETEGCTFKRYLTFIRLQEALRLFNETTLNISEITFKCGFDDPYYFSRLFKQYTGYSPRQFRNKY
jgi:two-component system response regulator YesN